MESELDVRSNKSQIFLGMTTCYPAITCHLTVDFCQLTRGNQT